MHKIELEIERKIEMENKVEMKTWNSREVFSRQLMTVKSCLEKVVQHLHPLEFHCDRKDNPVFVEERQNQPPEVFCEKRYSLKFHKIHRKTPVPEPLF